MMLLGRIFSDHPVLFSLLKRHAIIVDAVLLGFWCLWTKPSPRSSQRIPLIVWGIGVVPEVNFVVEPDLPTTNLDPKYVQIGSEYGPEWSQKRRCKI